jgi:hypothetical protein
VRLRRTPLLVGWLVVNDITEKYDDYNAYELPLTVACS